MKIYRENISNTAILKAPNDFCFLVFTPSYDLSLL